MSVSLNELTYRIFHIIKPKISDDESIDISEIRYDVESARSLIIKRNYGKKFKSQLPESIVQPINKLEIESINASNDFPGLSSEKYVMRTKLKVPSILEKSSGMPMIKRISSSTILSNNFTVATPQHSIYSGNGKFNQKNIFCFYENGYLYLITKRSLFKSVKYIDLYCVFERPTEYYDFMNQNYGQSLDYNDPYPVTMDMIDDIENMIINNKLRIESTQPIDDINDSSDTPKQIKNPEK